MNADQLRRELFPGGTLPGWGVVLGSGFGAMLNHIFTGPEVFFEDVDDLNSPSVPGHKGSFAAGEIEGTRVAAVSGRVHLYEGASATEVAAPVRILAEMGVSSILLTTAVGSLRDGLKEGDSLVVTDQLNLTGLDPHTGTGRFPEVSALYDAEYIHHLERCGFIKGILAGVRGPSFETPAEARALAGMGADVVCMSTVLETLALAGTGVRCACVAVVANRAGAAGTNHQDVLNTVSRSSLRIWPALERLISGREPGPF